MAMVTGAHGPLLVPGLRKTFFLHLKERPLLNKRLFKMDTSKRAFEEDYVMAGLPTTPIKLQGVGTSYSDPVSGGVKRYTHVAFGLGFRVTREMKDDDQYGPAKRMNEALARSNRNRINVDTFDMYNNGFTGTTHTTYEGVVLFSTSHTLARTGATQANRPTTDANLSVTTLQAGLETYMGMLSEEGFRAMIKPDLLMAPTASHWLLKELLDSELDPRNANNAVNSLLGEGLQGMSQDFLTDAGSWYLQALGSDNPFNWIQRTGIEYDASDDFDSGDTKVKTFMRYAYGATMHQGIYGTSGA